MGAEFTHVWKKFNVIYNHNYATKIFIFQNIPFCVYHYFHNDTDHISYQSHIYLISLIPSRFLFNVILIGFLNRKLCASIAFLVLSLEYSRRTSSTPWMLMPWLLQSPGHQPWYWLCGMRVSSSSLLVNLNNLLHFTHTRNDIKCKYIFHASGFNMSMFTYGIDHYVWKTALLLTKDALIILLYPYAGPEKRFYIWHRILFIIWLDPYVAPEKWLLWFTYSGWHKMAAIWQTAFQNAFFLN